MVEYRNEPYPQPYSLNPQTYEAKEKGNRNGKPMKEKGC